MLNLVAEIKGWHVEDRWEDELEPDQWGAVRKLEENWRLFQRGNHPCPQQTTRGRRHDSND